MLCNMEDKTDEQFLSTSNILLNEKAKKIADNWRNDWKEKIHKRVWGRESSIKKGVDLSPHESFIYPSQSLNMEPLVTYRVQCLISGFPLRAKQPYAIRAISRSFMGDLILESESPWVYVPEEETTTVIRLSLKSTIGFRLLKHCPCATLSLLTPGRISSVETIAEIARMGTQKYPKKSSFLPTTYHPDLPLPIQRQQLKSVRDYTEKEWDEVKGEVDKWIEIREGKAFMHPKPLVFLPIEKEVIDYVRHAMLAKQLSKLPDGCWFQENPDKFPGIPMEDVAIRVRLTDPTPIAEKMRRIAPATRDQAIKQLKDEVALGIWEPSNAEWACNILHVPKPDKSLRMCIDYRRINKVTIRDQYPIPRLEDIILNISKCKYRSLIDLTKGFNNLFIHPDDRDYLSFMTPLGLLRPRRLPFGWANGPAICQREVELTLGSLTTIFSGYIDDISGGAEDNQRLHDLAI